ncbi:MAG TPA: hypothetical protein VFX28_18395, partial [Methylomirabilota bacterium]|nr:hypothetical protein [Methylomirabilota bacterium]
MTRVLVLGAGTGAATNLMRSLRAGEPALRLIGVHDDRFVLAKSAADRNYVVPAPGHRRFAAALRAVVDRERVDLVIPSTDAEVALLSGLRGRLRGRLFLPRPTVIARCQDKYALIALLARRGVPVAPARALRRPGDVGVAFRALAGRPLWCRLRRGTGSAGAVPVRTPAQARAWIHYWETMRGVPPGAFMLSEYLPGRDFACQTLWRDGRLVLAKVAERLTYFGGASQ